MSGSVHFTLPDSVAKGYISEQQQYVYELVRKIRKQAEKKNIPVPKRITYGGGFGSFHIAFTNNQLRDLIIAMGKRRKLKLNWVS